jgi:hypothetical protein
MSKVVRVRSAALLGVAACFGAASCSRAGQGFDSIKGLRVEEVGEVPVTELKKPPSRAGEITWHRTDLSGQVIAAVRTTAPCPRAIHTLAGAEPKRDAIELCFTAPATDAPTPGFACSTDVYVRYELLGVPKDVEPRFEFKGDCLGR